MFVSVLMPTFNVEHYVAEAIESIRHQTHHNFELLVQDDGSTDRTLDVVQGMAAHDPRIKVLPAFEQNLGVVAARNSLLNHAKGAFIAWMDGDDFSAPQRLERQLNFLKQNPNIDVVGTAITYADEMMRPYRTQRFSRDVKRHRNDPEICCASIMARAATCKYIPFRKAFRPGGEDGDWLLRVAERGDITNIDDVLYTYRQHASTSKSGAAAIRRLGVLSRYATQVRHNGESDPIDALEIDDELEYIGDDFFLHHPQLSVTEKMSALTLPLSAKQPLVSVLIPHYNAGDYFEHCLQALADQTFRNFEVLIYDDGSDFAPSRDMIQTILGDVPFTLKTGETNLGVASARNALLEMSNAPFLAWQDADDYAHEKRLEKQVEYLITHPKCNAVGSAIDYVKGSVVTSSESYPAQAFKGQDFYGCCATFMLRKSAADQVGQFNTIYDKASEDVDFLNRIKPLESVQNDAERLYSYRRHDSQLTQSPDWMEAQAFYLFSRFLKDFGLAPIGGEPKAAEEMHVLFDAVHRLPRAMDKSPFGKMYLRMKLREIKTGKLSPLSLLPLAARFPRTLSRAGVQFATYRGGLLVNGLFGRLSGAVSRLPGVDFVFASRGRTKARDGSDQQDTINTVKPASILVQCLDNWEDLDDALFHLTPGGLGVWNDVAFVGEPRQTPDWHVVLNGPGEKPVAIQASPNRVIFAIGEPPTQIHKKMHLGQGEGTLVLTSDADLGAKADTPRRYIMHPCVGRSWSVKKTYDELSGQTVTDKPRKLSWVTSNLSLMEGHRYRLQFLDRLQAEVDFDLFGRGFSPIANKWDGLAPYRYSIAFENTKADYYFTEKLMDCFVADTMPIYFGSPIITEFFPKESMFLIDPEDPDVIDKIKGVINSDLWRINREAIREAKHLVLGKYNCFAMLSEVIRNTQDQPLPRKRMIIEPTPVDFGH